MLSLLTAPKNLFMIIEAIVEARPELLKSHHWHELASGREAFTEEQIMDTDTAHCLAGWVVALTSRGAEFERIRQDVDVYANEILVNSGYPPIPMAIYHDEEDSMLKVIKMRAAKERESQKVIADVN